MYIEWESAHTTHTIHISIQYLANLRKYIHGNTKEKQNQAVDKCKQQNKMTIQWSALKSTVIFNANNNRFVFLWWLLHAVLCSVDLSRLCVCIKCFSFIESFFFLHFILFNQLKTVETDLFMVFIVLRLGKANYFRRDKRYLWPIGMQKNTKYTHSQ